MPRPARKAAILGCGPAGLFAAHALQLADWDIVIFSKKRRSHMFGAQYLHKPIPGLSRVTSKAIVDYKLIGTPEQYAAKVYGPDVPAGTTSASLLVGQHPAWDIRQAYYSAYEMYDSAIVDAVVTHDIARTLTANYRVVVSSIPKPMLCIKPDEHVFNSQNVWASGDAPELDWMCPITAPLNTVTLNGENARAWYRLSNVFGHNTAEWPHDRKPPITQIAEVTKPISSTCDCASRLRIHTVGRYGSWQKGVLSHHAYEAMPKITKR